MLVVVSSHNSCSATRTYVFNFFACFSRPFFPYPSQRATARLQFVRFLHSSTPPCRQELSSPPVGGICGICRETLVPGLIAVLPCDHVFHHSCVEDVLRFARYRAALFWRVTVDCIMCGAPAIVSLLPGFGHVGECRPLPRQVRAVRAGDGFADEDTDGPLEPWHMFARRQNVRGGSAVLLALQEDVARLSYLAFIPAHGRGPWVRHGN